MTIGLAIFLFVITANVVLLGVLLRSNADRTRASRLFLLMILFLTLWTFSSYFLLRTGDIEIGNILNSAAFSTALLGVYCAVLFAFTYPRRSPLIDNRRLVRVMNIAAIIFAAVAALPLIAGRVLKDSSGQLYYTNPPLEAIYVVLILAMVVTIAVRYIRVFKITKGAERAQTTLLLAAFAGSILLGLFTNIVLPLTGQHVSYQLFGPLIVLLAAGFITYAITRKGLFDVRPVVFQATAHGFSVGVLTVLFATIMVVTAKPVLGFDPQLKQLLYIGAVSIGLAVLYQPVKMLFERIMSRYFYRGILNAEAFLNDVNDMLVNSDNLHNQLDAVSELIKTNFNVSFANFYIDATAPVEFHVGGTDKSFFSKDGWSELLKALAKSNQKIAMVQHDVEEKDIQAKLKILNVAMVQKMVSHNETVGYLLLGNRGGGSVFTSTDVEIIETVADEVAVAVQNSLRYEQIARFNSTLQKEINNATSELKRSNEKLMELDEAKDEFISMASHQLRTPLTSIKGYISMILDGDTGDISDVQRNFLTQAFVSSQHMAYLIGDLLNLSRIKTGKFVIDTKPVYLPDVVESEIEPLYAIAKAHNVSLVYEKPTDYPTVNLDENKTRQVIMNFVENALHYTPTGGNITVSLKALTKSIEYRVTDSGIGVPKADQHRLFTKFYRAHNARKLRPDGTGLGLFMAKKIIVAQGGAIIFETSEGKGSTFGFSFPLDKLMVTPVKNS